MKTLGSFCPSLRFTSDVVMCLRERIHLFEEPDALVALVRVCGGVGGDPAGTTRQNFQHPRRTRILKRGARGKLREKMVDRAIHPVPVGGERSLDFCVRFA